MEIEGVLWPVSLIGDIETEVFREVTGSQDAEYWRGIAYVANYYRPPVGSDVWSFDSRHFRQS